MTAQAEHEGRWPADRTEGWDPVSFGVAFVRAMRGQKVARWVPSVRTAIAIPRLLAARYLRTGGLAAADYLAVALQCTPLEDRALADQVARGLLYPDTSAPAPAAKVPAAPAADPGDPLAGVLAGLASLDLSSLEDLDGLLAAEPPEADPSAFALFERLYSSAEPAERSLGELIHRFGGPAVLEADAIRDLFSIKVRMARELGSRIGELDPDLVLHGVRAGYAPELRRGCTHPWELAGVLAASADPGLDAHLDDLLASGSPRELGRTLAFLKPHGVDVGVFAAEALSRALDLSDHAELAVGLGEWVTPDDDLLDASVRSAPHRAIAAAEWLETVFGTDLRPELLERWLVLVPRPTLEQLTTVAVANDRWAAEGKAALARDVAGLETGVAVALAGRLVQLGFPEARHLAGALATEVLVALDAAPPFLPVIDDLVGQSATPDSLERVLQRARELGVPEEEVIDRLGGAVEQLRVLVNEGSEDARRYQRLVERLRQLPRGVAEELATKAAADGNLTALAALLAIDMGVVFETVDPALASEALSHKGIGGGRNLLRQWFTHRGRVPAAAKARVKALAKSVLLDAAFDWMGKGGGSGEVGLVPQNQTRPFRSSDGLDALDLEETLDAVVSSGKTLAEVTEEDLFAQDTSRGKAALCVLVDISGSMGGGELAACAIAIVMLLGRLHPEEVALAAFESDTHAVKGFSEPVDLDLVADQVLELEATGGTRVEAALTWATTQFTEVPEADLRVLFLLSDFYFSEGEPVLRDKAAALAEHGARLLAASHGALHQPTLDLLRGILGGERLELDDLDQLPALLLAALADLRP